MRFEQLLHEADESEIIIKARLTYARNNSNEIIEREIGKLVIAADKREKEAAKYRAAQQMAALELNT